MSTSIGQNTQLEQRCPNHSSEPEWLAPKNLLAGVTLFWVEKTHRPHAACASVEYVACGKLGVHLELPVPLNVTAWIVLCSGSGCWGVVHSCKTVAGGYLAELHLTTR